MPYHDSGHSPDLICPDPALDMELGIHRDRMTMCRVGIEDASEMSDDRVGHGGIDGDHARIRRASCGEVPDANIVYCRMIINPTASNESRPTGERREYLVADPGSGSITVARLEGELDSRYHRCLRVLSRSGKLE